MASRKELLSQVHKLIPPMLETFHKGQLGRVAVIGGSEDYTGAPYFSAMASARLGADMSHVICEPAAAAVIKTYSPILMVHPYMRSEQSLTSASAPGSASEKSAKEELDESAQRVIDMLDRLHVLVIGPGLGRDGHMLEICARVVTEARKREMPFVLDADGLFLATTRPELIHGYEQCILTPNVVEFARLAKSQGLNKDDDDDDDDSDEVAGGPETRCERLSRSFGGVTIIQKGQEDYISNGTHTLVSSGQGGRKRAGGQGDTLTGCLATLLAYRRAYHDNLWEREGVEFDKAKTLALVAFAGSAIARECSRLAFEQKGRSMQAGDLTEFVHRAFLDLIGEPTELGN